jgi:hypothetical protein
MSPGKQQACERDALASWTHADLAEPLPNIRAILASGLGHPLSSHEVG